LGAKLLEFDLKAMPALQALRKDKRPGETIFKVQLDPYEVSLRHVGTHLLMRELNERAVREALEAGRVFVAFDWIADATGFDWTALSPSRRYEMGSRVALEKDLSLHAEAPLPVKWKLIRNGKVLRESTDRPLVFPVAEVGNYRVEAWLTVAGEEMIW